MNFTVCPFLSFLLPWPVCPFIFLFLFARLYINLLARVMFCWFAGLFPNLSVCSFFDLIYLISTFFNPVRLSIGQLRWSYHAHLDSWLSFCTVVSASSRWSLQWQQQLLYFLNININNYYHDFSFILRWGNSYNLVWMRLEAQWTVRFSISFQATNLWKELPTHFNFKNFICP